MKNTHKVLKTINKHIDYKKYALQHIKINCKESIKKVFS